MKCVDRFYPLPAIFSRQGAFYLGSRWSILSFSRLADFHAVYFTLISAEHSKRPDASDKTKLMNEWATILRFSVIKVDLRDIERCL